MTVIRLDALSCNPHDRLKDRLESVGRMQEVETEALAGRLENVETVALEGRGGRDGICGEEEYGQCGSTEQA